MWRDVPVRRMTLVCLVAAVCLAACGQAGAGATASAADSSGPATSATFTTPSAPTAAATCDRETQWRVPAANTALDDLAMTGPDDGWAVGDLTGDPGTPRQPAGVIYHFTRGQWRQEPTTYPGAELSALSMDSPTDGWAASKSALTGQGDQALVLHYTSGQWRQVDIPALDQALKGPPGTLAGAAIIWLTVRMFGPDAGWMFALTNLPRDLSDPASRGQVVILRYAHGVWTPIAPPAVDPTTEMYWLSAVSGDEAWLAETDYATSGGLTTRFAHFANGVWRDWPVTFKGVTQRMEMASPTDGWALPNNGIARPELLHFDGKAWSLTPTPASWASLGISLLPGVYPLTPGVAWFPLIGGDGAAMVAQYARGQWRQVAWPYADMLPARLVADGAGGLWGVGDIDHQQGCYPALTLSIGQGVFFHWTPAGWSRQVLV